MSRTYRRKNDWNKKQYIDHTLWHIQFYKDWDAYYADRGYPCHHNFHIRRYGDDDEKILAKLNSLFHGETPPNWDHKCYAKEYSRWYLRNKHKMQIKEALKTGTEDELQLLERKVINGRWWRYD